LAPAQLELVGQHSLGVWVLPQLDGDVHIPPFQHQLLAEVTERIAAIVCCA
jgi:hypothetical protein